MPHDSRPLKVVLASGSPRRKDLLSRLGALFEIDPRSSAERPPNPGEDPAAYALALGRYKASEGARRQPTALVIGADTVVTVAGLVLGKPRDEDHALEMLRLLRGRRHQVITGVSVCSGPDCRSDVVTSEVSMKWSADVVLRDYVLTGEPMDKAGGYALQGIGGQFVDGVSGCYNNVVGLPLCLTSSLAADYGVALYIPEGADPHSPNLLPGTRPS
jgi:septum formation protein